MLVCSVKLHVGRACIAPPSFVFCPCALVAAMPQKDEEHTRRMKEALMSASEGTGQLSMSAGGARRSGSSRGASTKGGNDAPDASATAVKVKVVMHCPDGRTCGTCPRRDDEADPVAQATYKLNEDGSVVLMRWGYPVRSGRTVG